MTWAQRLKTRLGLERAAKAEHVKAQDALEKARAKDLHPRMKLVIARDKASARLKLRRRQVAEARAHMNAGALSPERTRISPCKSSRGGARPRVIVLHITVSHNRPGLADIDAILEYFSHPSTQASSHIVNDAEGHDARCVPDAEKAWTQAAYNPLALSIEQIEYSDKRTRQEWLDGNRRQLDNTAAWIAYWSRKYGIPITRSTSHGVCQHRDLGSAGGGHSDCGPGYPLDYVLSKARKIAAGG